MFLNVDKKIMYLGIIPTYLNILSFQLMIFVDQQNEKKLSFIVTIL